MDDDYIRVRFGDREVEFLVLQREPQLKLLRADLDVVYTLAPKYGIDLFELQKPPQDPAVGDDAVKATGQDSGD